MNAFTSYSVGDSARHRSRKVPRATAVTACILIVIESMNVVVLVVEFFRYIFPAIVAASILTAHEGGCSLNNLVDGYKVGVYLNTKVSLLLLLL